MPPLLTCLDRRGAAASGDRVIARAASDRLLGLCLPPKSQCSDRDLHSHPTPIPSDLTTVNPISCKGC
ncbi:unnamed protein product [Urochloa humidicola]